MMGGSTPSLVTSVSAIGKFFDPSQQTIFSIHFQSAGKIAERKTFRKIYSIVV